MFKGLTLSIFIVTLLLIGPAYVSVFTAGDYDRQCKMSIAVPCFGAK